ncbi:MAG: hypothetical protein MJA83_00005, partial [Gammaproteobacteria bacterium]|nr:hypothetical protein [Gammaproteobacteria bacterium]
DSFFGADGSTVIVLTYVPTGQGLLIQYRLTDGTPNDDVGTGRIREIFVEGWTNGKSDPILGIKLDNKDPQKGESQGKGSPLVFDLDDDGYDLISFADSAVYFDLDADGFAERTAWVSPDDGLLALDRDGNGRIDDVTELFGVEQVRPIATAEELPEESGFDKLALLDSNADGVIDSSDAQFAELVVWQDQNSDGETDAGELRTLSELGITSIDLGFIRQVETQGQSFVADHSTFTFSSGSTGQVADIFFAADTFDTIERLGDLEIDLGTQNLPYLIGSGEASDLDVAMTRDPLLKQMVEDLSALTLSDAHLLAGKVEAILFRWFDVEDVAPDSRGFFTDGQRLAALEKLDGSPFVQVGVTSDPRPQAGALLAEGWQDYMARSMAQLLAQTSLGEELIPGFRYVAGAAFEVDASVSLTSILDAMAAASPTDMAAKVLYWHGTTQVLSSLR